MVACLGGRCGWAITSVVAVFAVIRGSFRCPVHPSPSDTSLVVGTPGWEQKLRDNLAEYGYAHVVELLNHSDLQPMRQLAESFCYGDPRRALQLSYGGYSVPGFLNVSQFAGAHWLVDDARLHRALKAVFNGSRYRFASHNDVGCDFVGVWHKDVLRGAAAAHQRCDVWSPDTDGERHEIVKVMFYLQDHVHDEQALKVIPGSHLERRTPWDWGYVALHPRVGDAVIFDQRLSHAGNTYYNPFGNRRLLMQVGFGRINRFTDEFERGTVQRQESLRARLLQSITPKGPMTVFADIKFTALGTIMSALPPQLLNHFADKEVKTHLGRSCS